MAYIPSSLLFGTVEVETPTGQRLMRSCFEVFCGALTAAGLASYSTE